MSAPLTAPLAVRDHAAIVIALVGVSLVAWIYLWDLAQGMVAMDASMSGAIETARPPWSGTIFALMFVMWWVMMLGMMLPGAMPMILTFATANRRQRARGGAFVPIAVFVGGYLAVWGGFSLAATLAQAALVHATLMLPSMRLESATLGGLLFICAGIYQWTPLKRACLGKCRTPVDFVINHWRDGRLGALRMGVVHGAFCVGCCAVLMGLLFAGGVMNLLWVAAIAVVVLVEKLLPAGERVARLGGMLLVGIGAYMILSA